MATPNPNHPALDLSDSQRMDYVMVIACMVYADGVADEKEQVQFRKLCVALELSETVANGMLATAAGTRRPDPHELAKKFTGIDLRTALLTDAIVMAFADGKIVNAEAEAISAYARSLDFTPAQAALIGRYVATVQGASPLMQAPIDSLFGRKLAKGIGTGEVEAIPDEKTRGIVHWLMAKLRGGK